MISKWDRTLTLVGATTLASLLYLAGWLWTNGAMPVQTAVAQAETGSESGPAVGTPIIPPKPIPVATAAATVDAPEYPLDGDAELFSQTLASPGTLPIVGASAAQSPASGDASAPPAEPASPSPVAAASAPVEPAAAEPNAAQPSGGPVAVAGPAAPAGPAARTYPFVGKVNGTDIYLRSGPAVNYYPTGKVQAGESLTVVGERLGWLEVKPPAGQFSWIDKTYVAADASGAKGTVTGNAVRIRAGSVILPSSKDVVQTKLNKGDAVEILGEADGFYKIRPPEGTTVWISADYIVAPGEAAPVRVAPRDPLRAPDPAPGSDPIRGSNPVRPADPAPRVENSGDELNSLYAKMAAELKKAPAEQDLDGLIEAFSKLRGRSSNDRVRQYCEYYGADLARRRKLQDTLRNVAGLKSQFDADIHSAGGGKPKADPLVKVAPVPVKADPKSEPVRSDPKIDPVKVEPKVEPKLEPAKVEPKVEPKPTPVDGTPEEITGYLYESRYWDNFKGTWQGGPRYRLTQGPPPNDLYLVWIQAADNKDLSPLVGKRVTLKGKKAYLADHRSHILLVEQVFPADAPVVPQPIKD